MMEPIGLRPDSRSPAFDHRAGNVKLLCLDIDGTLLDSHKELPQENVEAVHYAAGHGVTVALATGRSFKGVEYLYEALNLPFTGVCLNGGLVAYKGKIVRTVPLGANLIEAIVDVVERNRSYVFFATAEFNITTLLLSEKELQELRDGSLRSDQTSCDSYNALRQMAMERKNDILKASVKETDDDNFERIRRELLALKLFRVEKSDTCYVDICAKKSGKAKGVAALAECLGIPMERVMCIGDNENDVEMLQQAGIGIAMANAVPQAKMLADYVTTSNNEHGVAKAIRQFI